MIKNILFLWFCLTLVGLQAQSITVTSPNGGENWPGASNQSISWTSSSVTQVNIEFTTNNGSNWTTIITNHSALSTPYTWTVPGAGPLGSTQCRVRVTSATNSLITDQSNANFTIPPSGITVLFPNGGEEFFNSQARSIRWSVQSIVNVNIDYSTNNGVSWNSIATNIPANRTFHNWIVPINVISSQVLVRVVDASNTTVLDVADATFAIVSQPEIDITKYRGGQFDGYSKDNNLPKTLTVSSPNGGEIWNGATTQNITWNSQNIDNVRIEFSSNNGSSWNVIQATYPVGTGTLPWVVPSAGPLGSTQCFVRISNATDLTLNDVSNNAWSIPAASITLQSPDGGEEFFNQSIRPIRWTSQSVINVRLEYSTNNGSAWILINDSIPSSRTFFSWLVPANLNTSAARVRILDRTNYAVGDSSASAFIISTSPEIDITKYRGGNFDGYSSDNSAPKTLQLLTPNGGEIWNGATTQNITWTSQNISNVKLDFSSNNGSSWNLVINPYPASTGTYPWSVPGAGPLGSTQCLFRVSDSQDTTLNDASNNVWTITPSSITLLAPDGGEEFFIGTMRPIRWSSQSVQNVIIEYSTNNGSAWLLIQQPVAANRTFWGWVVPAGVNTANARVRVTSSNDSNVTDQSGSVFTIGANPEIEISKYRGGNFDGFASDIGCIQPIATLTGNQTICAGTTASLSIALTYSPPWNITWTDGTTPTTISGLTSSPYIFTLTPTVNTSYTLTNLIGGCPGIVSGQAAVDVNAAPTVTLTGDNTIMMNQTTNLSFAFTGPGPWNVSYTDGTSLFSQTGITSNPYILNITPMDHVTYSPVSVQNPCVGSVSGSAAIVVNRIATAVLSGSQSICAGIPVTLSVQITGPGPWNLTWTDGNTPTTVSGLTQSPYFITVTPSASTTYALVSILNPFVGSISGTAAIAVTQIANAQISGTQSILLNQSVVLSTNFTGTAPWNITYSDGNSNTQITGITSNPYPITVTPLVTTSYSLLSVSNICSGSASGAAVITVNVPPTAVLSGSQTLCEGNSAILTVSISGPGPWNLTWTDGSTPVLVTGLTQSPYLIQVTPSASTTYSLLSATNPYTGNVSGTAIVSVTPLQVPVTGLQALSPGCTQVTWDWSPVNGATSYYADIASDVLFTNMLPSWNNALLGNTVSLTLTGMNPGVTVYTRIRAHNVCSTSSNITGVSGTSLPVPVTPVTTTNQSILCSGFTGNWLASGNASSYQIEVSTTQNFSSLLTGYNPLILGNVLSHAVTGLQENAPYYWRVSGINACGTGLPSAGVPVTTATLVGTVSMSSNSPVCVGNTLQFTANSTYPGSSFQWSGPNGFTASGATGSRSTLTQQDSGVYQVSANAAGCATHNVNTNIVVNSSAVISSLGGNTPLCSGETLVITASVQGGGLSYLWYGPNGYTQVGNSLQRNIVQADSGWYYLHLTAAGCNTVRDSIFIQVNPSLSITVSNSGPLCAGAPLYLNATFVSGYPYSWTGPNGYTSNQRSPSISNTTFASSGAYTLHMNKPGCNPLMFITNVVIGSNMHAITSGTSGPICEGQTLNITATHYPDAIYSWTGPNGFTANTRIISISNALPNMAGQYLLTASNVGCSPVNRSTNATIYPILNPIASANSIVCTGGNLYLEGSSHVNAVYAWTGPNGFSSNLRATSITQIQTTQSGIYTYVVNQTACGSASTTVSILVGGSIGNISLVSNNPLCMGNTLSINSPSRPNTTVIWTAPDGFTSNNPVLSRSNIQTSQSGIYTYVLTSPGCGSTMRTIAIQVNQLAVINANSNSPICSGNVLNLSVNNVTGATYLWQGPSGWTASGAHASISSVSPSRSGIYSITVQQPGCGSLQTTASVFIGEPISGIVALVNSPVCLNANLNLSSTNRSGVNYIWQGPGGFSASTSAATRSMMTGAQAGIYTLSYGNIGCGSITRTFQVLVNNPAQATASNSSPHCAGAVVTLSGTGNRNSTYQWLGPNGYSANTAIASINNIQSHQAGVYTLNVTDPACGILSITTQVTVGANLNQAFANSNSPICVGSTLQLTAASISGAVYAWTGPSGFTSSLQNPSIPNIGFANSGEYSVTVSTIGCQSITRTHSVVINPIITASPGNSGPICQGGALYLTANSVLGGTYSWSGPGGFSSALQNPSIVNAQPLLSGFYTLNITKPGCNSASNTTSVQVGASLTGLAVSSNSPICENGNLNISATLNTGYNYTWTGPNGFISTLAQPLISNATSFNAGSYQVVVSSQGCGTVSRSIEVVVNSVPLIVLGSNSPICQGDALYLSVNNVSGATYSWAGPNGFFSSVQNPGISNVQLTRSGIYTLTMNTQSCGAHSLTTSVIVGSSLSGVNLLSNNPVCIGNTLTLTATQRQGFDYLWLGPDGFLSTQPQVSIPNFTTAKEGTYTMIFSSEGCGAVSRSISIRGNDPALVSASNSGPACVNGVIYFSSTAPAGSTFNWAGQAGFASTAQNPARTRLQSAHSGVYTLTANVPGCGFISTTTSVTVNMCRDAESVDPKLQTNTQAESGTGSFQLHGKFELVENSNHYNLVIWPNPNEGSALHLKWSDLSNQDKNITVKVYDATGKIVVVRSVVRENIQQSETESLIEFSTRLAKGVYMVETVHDGIWKYERLIVE